MKKVLMIAYHFPPQTGSSGIQRTLRFVQQLPEFGWEPIVLTAHPRAYERISDDLLSDIPGRTVVKRAFALDTGRHLAVRGRYPGFLARPDRWVTWKFGAVPAGLALIRKYQPQAIWSTYPIATAHAIGIELSSRSGLPWIADFRDPMVQPGYPPHPTTLMKFQQIEEATIQKSHLSIFTTPGAAREYRRRYPAAADRIVVLENGFDEASFAGIVFDPTTAAPLNRNAITLLHSGVVYPSERDPTQLFAAIARLVAQRRLKPGEFLIRFRAAGHDEFLRELAHRNSVDAFIEVMPPISYGAALEEMHAAEALLVLQAADCNDQIPAKVYEYLRAGRPILALTDPIGDTAGVMRDAGIDMVARLDSVDEIAETLDRFIGLIRSGRAPVPDPQYVADASRRGRAQSLASFLDRVAPAQ
ncbi:MAG: glycosyltransferase [Betaproteobacteria bacterium]